jgi:hypothetical protein
MMSMGYHCPYVLLRVSELTTTVTKNTISPSPTGPCCHDAYQVLYRYMSTVPPD